MVKVGDKVYLKSDPEIDGYKIGDTGTVMFIESHEYFYPVQVMMDHPDINGHSYYRFDYNQLSVAKTDDWLDTPISENMDIPL